MNDIPEAAAQLRAMALDFALRTPGHNDSEDVLKAAKAYSDFMLGGDQKGKK